MASTISPSDSSASPEPVQIAKTKKTQAKKKQKEKQKRSVTTVNTNMMDDSSDRSSQEDSHTSTHSYEPPAGYGPAPFDPADVDFGEFDWDTVKNNDDIELWLIRVPNAIRPKHVENLKIDYPSSSSRSARVGQIERKHVKYDVWSLAEASPGDDNDVDDDMIGGEELKRLVCLLPRKRKDGKLYLAPKTISRHLVLSASPALPTPPDASSDTGPVSLRQNPPRHSYPQELFKHRFVPYGSVAPKAAGGQDAVAGTEMVVDVTSTALTKSNKRSRESDLPKKSKKVKVSNTLR